MPTIRDRRRWARELDVAVTRIGPRFSRKDLRVHASEYRRGLISRVEHKKGWQLAEELGEAMPTNLQHFIARAKWNAEEVRDDLRKYVAEQLGDDEAVLIVEETGFLKKGTKSVGVYRQYSGTGGRMENCQIGVFFAFRRLLEDHSLCYVVAVSRQQKLWSPDIVQRRVKHSADEVPRKACRELSCGAGTKGKRFYRWTYLPFGKPQQRAAGIVYPKGLLVRESLEASAERAYYHFLTRRKPEPSRSVPARRSSAS